MLGRKEGSNAAATDVLSATGEIQAALSLPRIRRAQLSIHLVSNTRNDVRHGFHIRLTGVKVDNAGAKYVVATDYGVGDECLTATLQPIDQFTVERV